MKRFWDFYPEGKSDLLRMLTRNGEWLAWKDEPGDQDDATSKRNPGCHDQVEAALLSAIHSTNVVVLLGSGASFSAKNAGPANAPSMADLWHAVRVKITEDNLNDYAVFDNLTLQIMGSLPEDGIDGKQKAGNIESLLSLCKMSIELLEVRSKKVDTFPEQEWLDRLKNFVKTAEEVILKEVGFVDSETELPAHMSFLQKFSRRSPEKSRVRLFTTNYDLCVEMAALRRGVVLIDGFSHSAEQRFNRDHFQHDIVRRSASSTKADYLDGVFQLFKLHGSVDWRRRQDGIVIRSVDSPDEKLSPVLIYPRSSKYQEAFESPYLDMFAALQTSLREPDTTLVVAGFGFNDDHISAPIWSAMESNLSLRLILCDRAFIPNEELAEETHTIKMSIEGRNKVQKAIFGLVKEGDGRVTVLNGRFEDLVDALPMITGASDRQRLQERLDRIRGDDAE